MLEIVTTLLQIGTEGIAGGLDHGHEKDTEIVEQSELGGTEVTAEIEKEEGPDLEKELEKGVTETNDHKRTVKGIADRIPIEKIEIVVQVEVVAKMNFQ